jgi:hypothetical protein
VIAKLRSIFARPQRPGVDALFLPRYEERFRLGAIPLEGSRNALAFGATGSAPWFNPRSEADLKVLMSQPRSLLETDDPRVLQQIAAGQHQPHANFLIYQPWREPAQGNIRMLGALTEAMTPSIGQAVRGSSVKHIFLVSGGISPRALTALKEALQGHRLETIGVFWYYSGDDMTDDPSVLDELVALCQGSQTERLSLLTAAVDSVAEKRLVDGILNAPCMRECSVFEKDDQARYPRFRTPMLDAMLQKRAAATA